MALDLGADFERETIEAFTYWREQQLLIATDPKLIDDLTRLTVESWVRRLLRAPVYEALGKKRADINYVASFFKPEIEPAP